MVGMAVREDDGMDQIDLFAQQLQAQFGRRVDQKVSLGACTKTPERVRLFFGIRRTAHVAMAADHRHAVAGSGPQQNHLPARVRGTEVHKQSGLESIGRTQEAASNATVAAYGRHRDQVLCNYRAAGDCLQVADFFTSTGSRRSPERGGRCLFVRSCILVSCGYDTGCQLLLPPHGSKTLPCSATLPLQSAIS